MNDPILFKTEVVWEELLDARLKLSYRTDQRTVQYLKDTVPHLLVCTTQSDIEKLILKIDGDIASETMHLGAWTLKSIITQFVMERQAADDWETQIKKDVKTGLPFLYRKQLKANKEKEK